MKVKDLDLPVPYNETMDVVDSSKVQSFMDCPRGFFYRYVLGWERTQSNIHLVFGSAWHDAMEHILLHGYSAESIMNAWQKFNEVFMEGFPNEHEHDAYAPKNPAFALKALEKYALYHRDNDKNDEVIMTEIASTVPIREDRVIHTKLDSVIRRPDGIWSREHKTTGRNSASWRDKWALIIQIGSYTHSLYGMFPNEKIQGVQVNGTVFTKSKIAEFVRIPVYKTPQMMQEYLFEVNHWIDQMMWNYQQLANTKESDDVMTAFPKNGQSCSKFGCRYNGLCTAWQNPVQKCHTVPPEFQVNFWDPRRENAEDAKYVAEPDEDGKIQVKPKKQDDENEHNS